MGRVPCEKNSDRIDERAPMTIGAPFIFVHFK
jgi:hypothetical protein